VWSFKWAALRIIFFSIFVIAPVAPAQETISVEQKKEELKDTPRFEMEEVVVTASRQEQAVRDTARNVTVITGEDIAQATSNFVPELLSREANVTLRSLFGSDKNAGVDVRGMGETSSSNVLVLVDGFRLNPPDLSGPDFSVIPIGEIERIEIVRGANSVLYGDGAVGGVINIITKRGGTEPSASPYGSYGSYDTVELRASGGGSYKGLNLSLNTDYFDTDGYRDNGDLEKKDLGIRAGYDATDLVAGQVLEGLFFSLTAGYHDDDQGFPGGVPIEDIDDRSDRRKTRRPEDGAETTDIRARGGIETDFGDRGVIKVNAGLRDRESDFIFGFTPLKPKRDQKSRLEEDTFLFDSGYTADFTLWKLNNAFQLAGDYYYTDYYSERLDQRERKNSEIRNYGIFATNRTTLGPHLTLNLGYRYNYYDGTFRDDELVDFDGADRWLNGDDFDRDYHNDAVNIGLVYAPFKSTSLFASYATSFRIPNVDEFALADDDLDPQEGWHLDLGLRQRYRNLAEYSATFFYFEIDDEIFFDADARVNRNFEDTTRRTGVELTLKLYPVKSLYLWGNYTYNNAEFKGTNNKVPLVPEHTANFGIEWRPFDSVLLSFLGSFVDEKYDGNDQDNDTFAKIDPYQVFDFKASYTYSRLRIFGGINNLFDELYSTAAFSESYFTMPTRNYYAGASYAF
jgi:outer membrane receptor protein involved in Fe transport